MYFYHTGGGGTVNGSDVDHALQEIRDASEIHISSVSGEFSTSTNRLQKLEEDSCGAPTDAE